MRFSYWACLRLIYPGLVAAILFSPTALAADIGSGDGLPHVSAEHRHPRACRADDARCLALQRDVCDPWNVTVTDKCTFVQLDEYCMEDANRINYLAMFYCNSKILMVCAGLAWMVILFLIMTITAEVFLCPAIEYLAARMGMAPDIAGVTLFAFASGAPDLFTQVAALAAGDHVDIELAVSATFGGGLFIICVVFAAVILAGNADLPVPDRRSYIRDASAYMVATIATVFLLWIGKLTAIDGILLLGGYFLYLGLCLGTRSTSIAQNGGGGGGGNGQISNRHQYSHPSSGNGMNSSNGGDAGLQDAELEMIPFTLEVVNDPGSPTGAITVTGTATGSKQQHHQYSLQMSPKRSGPSKEPPTSPGSKSSSLFDTKLRPRTAAGNQNVNGASGVGGVSGDAGTSSMLPSSSTGQTALLLNPSLQRSASLPLSPGSNAAGTLPWYNTAALKEAASAWWRDLPSILEDTLHLHGKTGFRRYITYITAPLVLCMHATMPTLHGGGTFSMAYASVVALVAPPFFLFTASMDPATLGGSAFVTVWFSSTLVLITLAFVVHPIGSPAQFSSSFIVPSSPTMAAVSGGSLGPSLDTSDGVANTNSSMNGNPISHHNSLSPSFAAALQPAPSSKPSIFTGQRSRRCIFFALVAFVQCILWLNATAEEVVSIFEAIGRIWNVRRDTLGATVLAWGETVPDLVAVVSLSKAGQGTMAIAACFGGPVFNLLVSMGGPILIAGTRTGSIPYQMTSGVLVLVVSTVAVLVGLLVAVPLRYKWRLQRELGWVLLGVYAVSQVIFLLAEGIVIKK